MKLLNLFVLFIIITITSSAQTANDTILASQYYKKADSLLTERKLDSSIVYFKKALPIYEKAEAWEKVAGCYNRISENQWRNRKLETSLLNAREAIKISEKHLKKENQEEAYAYDNIGEYYYSISDYKTALFFYENALNIKNKVSLKNKFNLAKSYTNIGQVYSRKAAYDLAIKYFKKSELIYKKSDDKSNSEIVLTYNSIGDSYNQKGEYEKALKYFNKAIDIQIKKSGKKSLKIAPLFGNIAITYTKRGDYDKALEYFQDALIIFIEKFGKNHPYVSNAYNGIGGVYFLKGQYDKALEYSKKSLNIKLEKLNPSHTELINPYYNIGVLFEQEKINDKALSYFDKALSISKKAFGENHVSIGMLNHSIGTVYQNKMDYDEALKHHEKGLEMYSSILGDNSPKTAESYFHLGTTYQEKGDYDNAVKNYTYALKVLENAFGKSNQKIADAYRRIGDCYYQKKQYEKALTQYEKAFNSNSKGDTNTMKNKKLDPNNFRDLTVLLNTLISKANTLKTQYKIDKDKTNLEKSINVYSSINTLTNFIRGTYSKYNDKINFAKKTKEVYKEAIEAQLLLQNHNKGKETLNQVFNYAEKSKATTLKGLLNNADAKTFSGLPINFISLEKELKIDKAFYQSKINKEISKKEIDSTKLSNYENKLFDINRRQDSLTEVLEKSYPKYHQLKYNNEVISVKEVQKNLNDNQTLLEFFVADSITYAFTISKNELNVKELSTPKLEEKIEQLREGVLKKNTKTYKNVAYQLYQTLIAPVKDQIIGKELIIVPDGPLWHLNFDLLLTKDDDSNDPKELSYLLKDYAITYANSATLLFNSFKTHKPVEKLQECLAFSFTDSTNVVETKTMDLAVLRGTDDDLPGTREEIKAIADIIDGQYFYGSEANETNFKKNASQYNILHLALHGDVDNERPENSKLYFTKSKDTIEDNLLYSHELFALDIPAELTVLSACNTGTGKIATGEGIMSLGNAFQYAGTKSLLLSSWEVNDQIAPTLMKSFYANLKEGMNKAQALQQAKLKHLNTATINRTDPFYWGGFYLVGDASPIEFNDSNYLYWILGFSILAIILLSLFWYKKRVKTN
ncbi:tetratricopeptide repeat protein [Aquimarina sp. MMG016]|uniref:CHAT domain-containing protein n=1 Tax=Aquimarina sp. MMG016 TaxID=2822690 RepID=UPI001B3A38C8|nr:tetratricopeptide repeat protein [Aquimarina sp. MMG016]MBQ4819976.1 tetratricopeptide repeat protein [Aquimarina sp. MMG016]